LRSVPCTRRNRLLDALSTDSSNPDCIRPDAVLEERSRRSLGDFALTHRIEGYWDRSDVEIDLVALDDEAGIIRFGTCKRNAERLPASIVELRGHVERFLNAHPKYQTWRQELVAVAPRIDEPLRETIAELGARPQDLVDLTSEL
jgi:hypothetical protein